MFRVSKPRDDNLPEVILHSSECWERTGFTCIDFSEATKDDPMFNENVLVDNNYYNPILHCVLDYLVYGDTSLGGCYLDWASVSKMIAETLGG